MNNVYKEEQLIEGRANNQEVEKCISQKEKLEFEILKSTEKSLKILEQSEKLATTTTAELDVQHEQLKRLNYGLHDMNATLTKNEENIAIVKSNFGLFRSFINKQKEKLSSKFSRNEKLSNKPDEIHENPTVISKKTVSGPASDPANSSLLHVNGELKNSNDFNGRLNSNLADMSNCIGRLKGLAVKMGEELDSQNELIEDISLNTEKASITLHNQNKTIKKLL